MFVFFELHLSYFFAIGSKYFTELSMSSNFFFRFVQIFVWIIYAFRHAYHVSEAPTL